MLEALLPGLDAELRSAGLAALESPRSPGIELLRAAGGSGLLVPREMGGTGASARDAVMVQRAIGSQSPSLAVASTMHHFSVATLAALTDSGLEPLLVEAIAAERLIVASGFAEGTGQGVLAPSMTATASGRNLLISGRKKPCSLCESMDLLTVSVLYDGRLAVVVVPANLAGIDRREYWGNTALAGAQSGELILDNVEVSRKLMSYVGDGEELDGLQTLGFLWFEALITASYIGTATGLVERAIASGACGEETVRALAPVEAAAAAVDSIAMAIDERRVAESDLARALLVRYGVQDLLRVASDVAAEAIGGQSFAASNDITLLLAAARALAYHPPSRIAMASRLAAYVAGGTPLRLS